MKKILLTLGLCLALSGAAQAKTPPEVLSAYKKYNEAMKVEDYSKARKFAKEAWQLSEKTLGDSSTTGDLAFNYGFIQKNTGDASKAVEALERSIELASFKSENVELLKLEREVELVSLLETIGEFKKSVRRVDKALKFASKNNIDKSIYAGELQIHKANACLRTLNRNISSGKKQIGSLVSTGGNEKSREDGYKKCSRHAKRALEIFENNRSEATPLYLSTAYKIAGYSSEIDSDWLSAALYYQSSRLILEESYPREHPLVADSIGRWINARNYLKRTNKLELAKREGLCDCWPYSGINNKIFPLEAVDPKFPGKAMNETSGYAIVKYDISDSGEPINISIVNSWPEDVYNKASIKAISQWKYPAKAKGENESDRKELMQVFSYYLSRGLDPI
jgi:TonB family protein